MCKRLCARERFPKPLPISPTNVRTSVRARAQRDATVVCKATSEDDLVAFGVDARMLTPIHRTDRGVRDERDQNARGVGSR